MTSNTLWFDGNKTHLSDDLLTCVVTGGGVYGPGLVEQFNAAGWVKLRWDHDGRSGSKRSGYVSYTLATPGLYRLTRVAIANSRTADVLLERDADGAWRQLTSGELHARQIALYPDYARVLEARQAAEAARAEAAAMSAQRRAEEELAREQARLDLSRRRAEEAAEAAKAAADMALPALRGSDRQIAWANTIRIQTLAAGASMEAVSPHTAASWWIDYRDALARDPAGALAAKPVKGRMPRSA